MYLGPKGHQVDHTCLELLWSFHVPFSVGKSSWDAGSASGKLSLDSMFSGDAPDSPVSIPVLL